MSRVVILVDGDSFEVLENKQNVDIEIIMWEDVTDFNVPDDTYEAIDKAIWKGDVDEALEIYKGITDVPIDGPDEPQEIVNP